RKGYQKLHALIDIDTRVMTDYAITPANMADIKQFRIFLERMAESKNRGTMCADAAYLARDICTIIEELGYIPRIKPKSNSTAKAKGHMSWRRMMIKFQEQYDEFKKEYGQRNIVESVFGTLKQVYGNCLTMRRPDSRDAESALRVVCYNAARIIRNRYHTSGSIYPEPHIPQQNKDSPIQKHKPPDPEYTYVDLLSAQEAVQQMLDSGMLRTGEGQNTHQVLDAFVGMTEPRVPSFYPEGSPQRRAALAAVAS
ncbi:MAG: transposase, partial [Cenarchaeum sp. SB0677_bin_16]|nr:transposase [Cenarchaeum sp. SB0677_bin_16]